MYASAHPEQEVCGFVLSDGSYIPIRNVAEDTVREFVFQPDEQSRAVMYLVGVGVKIVGVFHSHPGGSEVPSETDLAGWPRLLDGSYCRYWIIANRKVLEFEVQNDRPVLVT